MCHFELKACQLLDTDSMLREVIYL